MIVTTPTRVANGSQTQHPEWIDDLQVSIEAITPDVAEEWLASNGDNYRKMRPSHVRKMRSDLEGGRWKFTNASIAFDVDGNLVDGQHRLQAIVDSGKSAYFLVVRGMPQGSTKNPCIDTGARRSVGTHLHHKGVFHANICAAAGRVLLTIQSQFTGAKATAISDSQIADLIEANESIVNAADKVAIDGGKVAQPSITTAWFWIAQQDNAELAEECLSILFGREAAITTHPFAKCREHLISVKSGSKSDRVDRWYVMRALMAAWTKAKQNEEVKVLRPQKNLRIPVASKKALLNLG